MEILKSNYLCSMAIKTNKARPLFLFYLLFVYVLFQFIWWSYLMLQLNGEIFQQRMQILELKSENAVQLKSAQDDLETKLEKRKLMIIGEGSVFLVLLITGFLQTRSTFKKEFELARRQKNFLLSVTHELKSPIASARLQLENLLKHDLPLEMQKDMIKNALEDTERLNALVENVLFATRLEDINFRLFRDDNNFSEFLERELNRLSKQYQAEKKHQLITSIQPNLNYKFDHQSFTSVLTNLYENAVKYSTQPLEIVVDLKLIDHKLELNFADNGIGMDESEFSSIFEKFYRIGSEETRNSKGTGLGLYIVKQIVQLHQGSIKVAKNSPKGSIFHISLFV